MNHRQNLDKKNKDAKRSSSFSYFPYLWPPVITLLLVILFLVTPINRIKSKDIPYSTFLNLLEKDEIKNVTISETKIYGEFVNPHLYGEKQYSTIPLNDSELIYLLQSKSIPFKGEKKISYPFYILSWFVPLLIFYLIWKAVIFKNIPQNLFSLTKSKAKIYIERDIKITFEDVAGIDQVKEELKESIEYLRSPQKFTRLGGRSPKGVLLIGPPGVGKTLLAKAMAGEAKVPFFSINGPEFVEMFVGLGAARVRDLFMEARRTAPCILFIDEIDSLGKYRSNINISGANDEKEQTLNQLLAEMDGFDTSNGVIILAATNRPDILDPALLRSGRFDRQIVIEFPDKESRKKILKVHLKKIQSDPGLDLDKLSALTPGFSGADLANLVNEAALTATRREAINVNEKDFSNALDRMLTGIVQKKIMSKEEKKRIAFHEMGHATVAMALESSEKIHKISIIPRGNMTLGYTLQRPTEERYLMDKNELQNKIAVFMAGRTAEEIYFKEVSTGSANDLSRATELAYDMAATYGMSEDIGPISLTKSLNLINANSLFSPKAHSEQMERKIDNAISYFIHKGINLAHEILIENQIFFQEGVNILIEKETIDEGDLAKLKDPPKSRQFRQLVNKN